MVPQRPSKRPYPAASPYRTLPTGWRSLLIGIAFGFSAGFLFTIGIISLINANNTATIQPPVGNAATSVSITETPTPTPTLPPTPTPISIPTPTPTPIGPGGNGSVTLFRPDEVSFYVIVFLIFLVLSAFVLFRGGGGGKK